MQHKTNKLKADTRDYKSKINKLKIIQIYPLKYFNTHNIRNINIGRILFYFT